MKNNNFLILEKRGFICIVCRKNIKPRDITNAIQPPREPVQSNNEKESTARIIANNFFQDLGKENARLLKYMDGINKKVARTFWFPCKAIKELLFPISPSRKATSGMNKKMLKTIIGHILNNTFFRNKGSPLKYI
ncbi:MAG: hypothetical protein V4486_02040 [Patescibacteria group bacterium]